MRLNIEQLYRQESGPIRVTLIRLIRDFDVAEEVVQEVFAAALSQWRGQGEPDNPRAWLCRAARNKAIDRLRRRARQRGRQAELVEEAGAAAREPGDADEDTLPDDQLQLIFTCCHPALPTEAQVALTLCGLTTEEIARAFLVPVPTMAQRLTRARARIRNTGVPYQVPPLGQLPERLGAVMVVVYLVFTEGYAASVGDALVRRELCAEAIRLGRLLCQLMPGHPEVQGLLALMLLHDARAAARTDEHGRLVLLEEQDRSRGNHGQTREGAGLVEEALRGSAGRPGPYTLQAAIAALHGQAARPEDTDWRQIAAPYALLVRIQPSPVIELNRAVAVAMADGPEQGLRIMETLAGRGDLRGYHLLHTARADLLRRLGRRAEAAAYEVALALCSNAAERAYLSRRLAEVTPPGGAERG